MSLPPTRVSPEELSAHAGRLIVDLDALAENYRALAARAGPAEAAAVVKADAYGTGVEGAVPALSAAGCRTFFTAILAEARRVKALAPDATVYALGGLAPGCAGAFAEARVRPVLGSPPEIEEWAEFCRSHGKPLAAALHADTGMNRLGLSLEQCRALSGSGALDQFEIALVMTHPACADDLSDPATEAQRRRFDEARALLPAAPASFANSAATLRDAAFHYDLVRPGIALYGGAAVNGAQNPMRNVVTVTARIVQLRDAKAGEAVGYGAVQHLRRDSRLAILSAGYADGYVRLAGGSDARAGGSAFIDGTPAPLVGRVSMDLVAVDVTDLPEDAVAPGREVVLIGEEFTVDDVARLCGTIGYEILTRLGPRFLRQYAGGPAT
ncbi:alanine racemase [Lutibaculum baratangense]|uniref:Alanine racemase n=1 Tax=Lutibaculum baratangense AMV1 TaxID=631454 RepID=V4TB31_9HYPH|nr:alanine racemase [Lutibaculum baratangense]ESR23618.1 Alanine racemase [Lutibaculum baratangense AMV1]